MTVRVTKSAKTIKDGILNMKDAMIFDYQGFIMNAGKEWTAEAVEDFVRTIFPEGTPDMMDGVMMPIVKSFSIKYKVATLILSLLENHLMQIGKLKKFLKLETIKLLNYL